MYLSAELIYNCHVLYIYSVGSRPGTWFCIAGLHTWTCSHIQATPRWSLQTLVALCTTHVVSLQQLNYTLQTYFKTKTLGNKIWRSYYTSLKIFKLRLLLFFPNWKSIIFENANSLQNLNCKMSHTSLWNPFSVNVCAFMFSILCISLLVEC